MFRKHINQKANMKLNVQHTANTSTKRLMITSISRLKMSKLDIIFCSVKIVFVCTLCSTFVIWIYCSDQITRGAFLSSFNKIKCRSSRNEYISITFAIIHWRRTYNIFNYNLRDNLLIIKREHQLSSNR